LKLLFDENLSSRLVGALADQFPDSSHVSLVGLASATDQEIWAYAREHGFTVISKDDDFRSLSLVNGTPPKVIWLRIGNASTAGIEAFIRSALVKIRTFEIIPARPVVGCRRSVGRNQKPHKTTLCNPHLDWDHGWDHRGSTGLT